LQVGHHGLDLIIGQQHLPAGQRIFDTLEHKLRFDIDGVAVETFSYAQTDGIALLVFLCR
jgi:hypothetical protein